MGQQGVDNAVTEGFVPEGAPAEPLDVGFWVRLLGVLLSAWMIGASTYPYGWWFLHPFAAIPLLVVLPGARRPWLWLLLYGTVAEAHIFVWIQQTIALFSNIPGVLAWGILGLFSVVFGLPLVLTAAAAHPLRRRLGPSWVLAWPAVWVLIEWLAQYVILFPYPQGATQHRALYLWQLASITGAWGLSFLLGLTSAVGTEVILAWREGRGVPWRLVGLVVGVYALVAGGGAGRLGRLDAAIAQSEVLKVGQVQSEHGMRWRMRNRARDAFRLWLELTDALPKDDLDLVIWPEGAVPYDLNSTLVAPALWDVARNGGFDMVVGSGTREREPDPGAGEDRVRVFNSVYVFDRSRMTPTDDVDPTPQQTWDRLVAAGCDLQTVPLVTPWEATAVLAAGRAKEGDPDCLATVQAHAARWDTMQAPEGFVVTASTGVSWPVLRTVSARFGAPMQERRFHQDTVWAYHQLDAAGCTNDDCANLIMRCPRRGDGPCDVVPEPPHYDKLVPLPFGEYLPLREVFPWLADLIRGPGNFRAGTDPLVFDVGGIRFATPICYEGILSYVCTRFEGAELLINVTNDAWFGDGAASDLHGMLVLSRAMELGLPVVRSTYTGTSFVALPSGRVTDKTPLFTDVSRVVDVPQFTVRTVYARWGDWFVAACAVLLAVLGLRARSRGQA